jgi:DNA mismatch endonuclease (patch repair protein)
MLRQKRADTRPEQVVRRVLHALGHRFRLGNRDLPGSPDLANRARGWALFVHGCYWHHCPRCYPDLPKTHTEFWARKFELNRERDARKRRDLEDIGWHVIEAWECDVRDRSSSLLDRIATSLSPA